MQPVLGATTSLDTNTHTQKQVTVKSPTYPLNTPIPPNDLGKGTIPSQSSGAVQHATHGGARLDLPPAFAGSDMIRWSRVLLSHELDAARSY